MKILFLKFMLIGTIMLSACQSEKEQNQNEIIGKSNIKIENGLLTPEILNLLGKVSSPTLSPDKKQILYGVTYTDIAQNKRNRELFVINTDGSGKKQITHSPKSEQNGIWIDNGKKIAFLSSESGKSQIWTMSPDGSNRKQLSDSDKNIDGFGFSPDGKKIVFFSNIKSTDSTSDIYPDLPQASGRIVDDLMYKHWDEWVESIPHPFIANIDENGLSNITDILEGEPYECPMKPFGGIEDLSWSPDGKKIAYVCRKKTGKEYAVSTNSDIYLYNIDEKKSENITEGMMGYDTNPVFSPDGKYISWLSMERDGYESDKNRLFIINTETGEKEDLTGKFDYNTESPYWSKQSQSIYFLSVKEGLKHIFNVQLANKEINQITNGCYDYASIALADDQIIALRHSMSKPDEIYSISLNDKSVKELSFENKELLDQLNMGKVEERRITTTDNREMLTWVVYPPDFDPNKKYPAILYCQGGPQSPLSQFWSTRWNLQLIAANGYIVIAPNRRGVPGFGQEWTEQISGDYGGQNMQDYLAAVDALKAEPFIDEDRLGAVGASYGGFSVYWLAGNHNKRFKTFIAHAGIFNLEQQYAETEETWFANWDLGGAFWDKENKTAQKSYENSPHKFVQNWDSPILITHGEHDYRILASQGMAAFNAAKLKGVPAKMLIFPDETHWIVKPQNSVLFHRVFIAWLDQWLKTPSKDKK